MKEPLGGRGSLSPLELSSVTILSGGTGSAKFIRGLKRRGLKEANIIVNIGDNFWHHGLYIAPDIDTVMYALSGILDESRGWGIKGDTFHFLEQLGRLGAETWFGIGDRDLATHIMRTQLLRSGLRLSEVTEVFQKKFGLKYRVLPASDDPLETKVITDKGGVHLQEYWVKNKAMDRVFGVRYDGSERARPADGVIESILESDAIIVCPANPITSIGPILAVQEVREALKKSRAKVVSVSPMVGKGPISGPAGRLMEGLDIEASSLGVAKLYTDFLNAIFIDSSDAELRPKIEGLGIKVYNTNIIIKDASDEVHLAEAVLDSLKVKK